MGLINGRPFHVVGAGCVVRRQGGRLVAYKDEELRASAPLTQISEVVLTGRVTITTPAMHALLAQDVPVILLSGAGRPLGRLEPPRAPHILARQRQLVLCDDPGARLAFTRAVVRGKVHNQRALLRRRAARLKTTVGDTTATSLRDAIARLTLYKTRTGKCTDIQELLGVEGAAASTYYRAIRSLLDPAVGFTARNRHGRDVMNALTNYCSALLRETVISAILAAGLDPYVSLMHRPTRGRPTLAFDLMEEWRPVLLDSTVLALLGLRAVTRNDLELDEDTLVLSSNARAHAVERFHSKLNAAARSWPPLPELRTYGDQLHAQARQLRTWFLTGDTLYEPFRWR